MMPVSRQTPSRFGPRHCGQSSARQTVKAKATQTRRIKTEARITGHPPSFPRQLAEAGDEVAGDGPGFAVADCAVVNFDNRDDLGGAAGEEAFVGDVDVMAREWHLADFDPCTAGEFDDRVARNALEDSGVEWRRLQNAASNQGDVVAGGFGNFPFLIEHQGFDTAGFKTLDFGQ